MSDNLEVILVDDHKIFRLGLAAILESIDNVDVIGEAEDSQQLFTLLKKKDPDIIFMDVNLERESGIDITKKVLARYPDILVIAITSSEEINSFKDMLEAGASAFLLKNATEKELQKAIEEVVSGKNYFSKEFLFLAKQFSKKPKTKSAIVFSERETEVLKLICKGHSNQEIADKINLSIHTVDSHRRNLLTKTGARNTASLVMIALRDELISLD